MVRGGGEKNENSLLMKCDIMGNRLRFDGQKNVMNPRESLNGIQEKRERRHGMNVEREKSKGRQLRHTQKRQPEDDVHETNCDRRV